MLKKKLQLQFNKKEINKLDTTSTFKNKKWVMIKMSKVMIKSTYKT